MANAEKLALVLIQDYTKIVSSMLTDFGGRILALEAAVKSNPEFLAAYNHARDSARPFQFPSALPRQLRAIEETIAKLQD
jgi:hypothetical protein